MSTMMKRIISFVLCFVLAVGYLPVGAIAAENGTPVATEATEVTTEPTQAASEETEAPSESTEVTEPEVIAVTGITLDKAAVEVGVGELPMTLTATVLPENATDKTVTWESSEPGVVSVENGVLTFGYMGTATITATAGEFSASCTVTVDEGEWSGYADDTKDYLFIATDRHANTSVIGNIINNLESAIGENELDYLALGGDMVGSGSNHPAYNSSTVLGEVTDATSSLSATNVDIVAGIHDMNVTDDAGIVLPYQGGGAQIFEGDRFYVYGVEEYCISEDSDSSNWSSEAQKFVTWANGSGIDTSKVIIVVSHYPLHAFRDDNDGAYYWHQALNTVATGAASGDSTVERDIVFFHGHNHTKDSNEYVYNVGDKMSIQNGSSTTSDTIYYTYATAGYLNQNKKATLVTITDEKISLTKYSTSGSGTDMTSLDRVAEPVTLTSIAVTTAPTTVEYTVGDAFSAEGLVVTATYSDGSNEAVTGYTLSEVDMTTAGEKEVTVTYEGMTASFKITVKSAEPTVNTVECWDDTEQVIVEATGLGLTEVTATNMYGEYEAFFDVFTDHMAVDVALTGLVEGESVKYSISVVADLDVTNLELYYVDENGELTPVECKLVTDELNNVYVEFTADHDGTFVYGSPKVPEGYVLTSLALANIPRDVFLGGSLILDETAEITATYTMEGAEDFVRRLTVYDYGASNFSGFDVNVAGEQTVTFTFEDVTATHEIFVWGDSVADETSGVTVALDINGEEYGVTAVNVAESANTHVETAVANVMSSYVAYDISLVYEDGYAATEDIKTVTLPIPEGVVNPVVYYVSDNGYNVVDMKATVSEDGKTVSFETKHFSTYAVGEGTSITVPDEETATGSTGGKKTVYKLTTSIATGNEYLIVDTNSAGAANILSRNGSSYSNTTATVVSDSNGTYIVLEDATDELWSYGSTTSGWSTIYTFKNGDYYLYYTSSGSGSSSTRTLSLTTSTPERSWSYSNYQLTIRSRYLTGGSSWSLSSTADNVYFYVATEIDNTVSGTYSIAGTDETVAAIKDSTFDLTSTLVFTPTSGDATTTVDPEGVTYAVYEGGDPLGVISGIDGNTVTLSGKVGKALVKVSYTTDFGEVTDYITVTATTPHHYSVQLHEVELTVAEDVTADSFASGTYYIFDSTTGFYIEAEAYVDGATYYTLPVILGDEITAPIALKGIEAGESYAVWAVVKAYATAEDTEGVDVGTLGDALSWTVSDESIATINTETGVITFTGTNYGTFDVTVAFNGADGKTITDTITISATESLYVVPGDGTNDFPEYPNQGAVRFDKTATAVGNFSETGLAKVELSMTGVPYSTGNAIDVLLMIDMSTSMDTEVASGVDRVAVTIEAAKAFAKTIVQNDDGTYNSNKIAIKYFNGSSVYPTTDYITVSSDAELEELYDLIEELETPTSTGTYYSTAMQNAYNTVVAQDAASDNTQALVFMSDGGPTYYTYLNDSGTGTTVNSSTGATFVGWFDVDDNDTTDETDDTATPNSSFKTEYYSYLLKQAGYPVYTVGLGLSTNDTGPSSYTGLTSGAHEAITSYILSQMATSSSYFYNVADSDAVDNMGNIFSGIAASIKEAARDVVVEDKIGNNYTVSFGLPDGITSDATDGLEDFYIQVVDYILDSTTHERTGVYTVLENFTFDGETGELTSHTVDGVECTDCDHVTTTNGVITAINGTYFTYKSDSTGEYLTWEAEKLTSTELALQYFAYLDNSAGTDVQNQIAAGTYYTNEYATLTYTNVNNKVVQQEFPIPQMTWNGAQVSYVFYLVNDDGQPVNRAGKVIPFAEAVYVTDVYTYSVIWNDLEQSAGLEARYLAEDKVPDAYALYDDDATYQIHVYEDETEVNLNNHFVIGGDVTDDYNTTWDNAKTTYVFNAKSDATKYTATGTYVADNGNEDLNQTNLSYFCKSASIEGATVTTSVENDVTVYTVTSVGKGYQTISGETQATVTQITAAGGSTTGGTVIGNYIYYVDENGEVYTIVQKTNGTEVEKGFDFANTTVAFAVVWKPELVEDTVVIDYGLDVVIDVIRNDNMAAGVVGVRTDKPDADINSGTYTAAKATAVDVYIDDGETLKENKIGTATVVNLNQVRFSLDKDNGMQFTDPAVFYYEADVNFYDSNNVLQTTSMYSKVTVIPATTVYYEDEFVTLQNTGTAEWITDGTTGGATQAQDRPGESKISEALDADNVHGYDAAYSTMSKYSLGSAKKITVSAGNAGRVSFTFYGTGFDVISMTSNTTGTIFFKIYSVDENGNKTLLPENGELAVDTYYGMNSDGTLSQNNPEAIYQVPVMKVDGLTYGKYYVTITATYQSLFDHDDNGSYDFYLDAIRIYDPIAPDEVVDNKGTEETTDDVTVGDIYEKDGEAYPEYYEVRNMIIEANTFDKADHEKVSGIVFIDGVGNTASVADYVSFGPNNEVYLAKEQAIAFTLNAPNKTDFTSDKVHIGLKSVGGTAKVKVSYIDENQQVKIAFEQELATATDMYYDITALNGETVVIESVGDAILSITNVKFTYKTKVAAASGSSSSGSSSSGSESAVAEEAISPFTVRMEDIEVILAYLRGDMEEEIVPEIPEVTEPETEAPAEPEVTEPEATEPEVTEPETEPAKPDNTELKAAVEAAKKLKEKGYTKESFKALKAALKDAEKVLKDRKATQAEIDEALAELNGAVEALEVNAPATKPGKNEKPNQNKPGKNESSNQNKPANNKGPAAAAEQVQKVAEAVGKIAEALFGWMFR